MKHDEYMCLALAATYRRPRGSSDARERQRQYLLDGLRDGTIATREKLMSLGDVIRWRLDLDFSPKACEDFLQAIWDEYNGGGK